MNETLTETIENSQVTALDLLKDFNKRLMCFLDNQFIPRMEKKRISDQVFENMIRIAHMERKFAEKKLNP